MILPHDLDLSRPYADVVEQLVAQGVYDQQVCEDLAAHLLDPDPDTWLE